MVWGLVFRIWSLGFEVLCFGGWVLVLGLVFEVLCFGGWVLVLGFGVPGSWIRVWVSGFRILGFRV
jgi:hypothetical protein